MVLLGADLDAHAVEQTDWQEGSGSGSDVQAMGARHDDQLLEQLGR